MATVTMTAKYGLLKEGDRYSLIDEGLDWVLINWRGKPLYVPKFLAEVKVRYTSRRNSKE